MYDIITEEQCWLLPGGGHVGLGEAGKLLSVGDWHVGASEGARSSHKHVVMLDKSLGGSEPGLEAEDQSHAACMGG
jgi:hypothetical protein